MQVLFLFSTIALAIVLLISLSNDLVSATETVDQKIHSRARLSKRGRHYRDYFASGYEPRGSPTPPSALPALPALAPLPALPALPLLPQLPPLPTAPVPALPKTPALPTLGGKSGGGGEDDEEDED